MTRRHEKTGAAFQPHNEGAILSVPSDGDVFLFPIFHSLHFKLKSLKWFCLFCTMTCRECTSDMLNIPLAQLGLSQNVILSAHWCAQLENTVWDCSIYCVLVLKLIIRLPKCDFDLVWNMKMASADYCFGCIFMHETLCTTWRAVAVSHILLCDLGFASVLLLLYIWTIVYMDENPKPKQSGVSCACESGVASRREARYTLDGLPAHWRAYRKRCSQKSQVWWYKGEYLAGKWGSMVAKSALYFDDSLATCERSFTKNSSDSLFIIRQARNLASQSIHQRNLLWEKSAHFNQTKERNLCSWGKNLIMDSTIN